MATRDAVTDLLRSQLIKLSTVGHTFQLAGQTDPTKINGGHERILPLRWKLECFRWEEPSTRTQLDIPILVIIRLQQRAVTNTTEQDVADLCNFVSFFLLRVGEYTMPVTWRCMRTIQFRVRDVRFYRNGLILDCRLPVNVLALADGVLLYINNQKNGIRGETIHHHALL